jgi:hypothetical protein
MITCGSIREGRVCARSHRNSRIFFLEKKEKKKEAKNLSCRSGCVIGGKAKFAWGRSQQQAFDDLKQHLCSNPILSLPNLQHPFDIKTYASDYAVGTVLTQHNHSVAYHSETMSDTIRKYPTYDKEF